MSPNPSCGLQTTKFQLPAKKESSTPFRASQVASCAGLEAPLEQDLPDLSDEDPLSPVPQGPANSPPQKHRSPELAHVRMTSDAVAQVEPGHVADPGVSTESLFTLEVENEARRSGKGRSVLAASVNTPVFQDEEDGGVNAPRSEELEAGETRGAYEPRFEEEELEAEQERGTYERRFEEEELEEGEEDLLAASTDSEWAAIRALMTEEEAPEVESAPVSPAISGSLAGLQAPDGASDRFKPAEADAVMTSWSSGDEGDAEVEGGVYGSPERTFSDEYFGSHESTGEAEVAYHPEDRKAAEMATNEAVEKGSKSPRKKGVLSWLKRKSPNKAAAPGEPRSGEFRTGRSSFGRVRLVIGSLFHVSLRLLFWSSSPTVGLYHEV